MKLVRKIRQKNANQQLTPINNFKKDHSIA